MSEPALSIGDVAARTGVAVSALRYYDELGLVSVAARVGGKRRFGPDAVGRVNFIRSACEAGFSLDEVAAILDERAGGWRELVDTKLSELTARRDRLNATIEMLAEIRRCGCDAVATCDISPNGSWTLPVPRI